MKTSNEKFALEQKAKQKYLFMRFKAGLSELFYDRRKAYIVIAYIFVALIVWLFRNPLFKLNSNDIFAVGYRAMFGLVYPIYAVGGVLFLIVLFGTPFGSKGVNDELWRVGLINHAGETPFLTRKHRDRKNPDITIWEFQTNGTPLSKWEKEREEIESALNINIIKIVQGTDKQRVILHTVSGSRDLPKIIYWKDDYLSDKNFELVLGESLLGRETVNLAEIPHMLLGGATGSGKSVLLKHLIMQCVKKGATVYVADFKGAVDYPAVWHEKCRLVTDEKLLLEILTTIVDILEERKGLLRIADTPNLAEYNKVAGYPLPRIVFACDEIAEILDKSGLSKENKELVTKIESKLSVIARQGRAFGLHLFLSTQRPDSVILGGQIRSNLACRICGRADNILSQIILDSADAADRIPKDAQGRFLTNEGVIFQGYLFDESRAFERGG